MMKWIIDDMMTDTYYGGQFYQTLKRLNRDFEVVQYIPFETDQTKNLNLEGQYIAYGSLQFVEKITRLHSNVASFGPSINYDFNCYSAYIDSELFISTDYCLITMSFLMNENQKQWLFNNYGNPIFIRPNTGKKLFSGQVIDINDPTSINNLFRSGGADYHTLAVVSSAVNIQQEWRFVVSKNKGVLTGSTYSANPNSEQQQINQYPFEAKRMAEDVMNNMGEHTIDELLVIDIALTEKETEHGIKQDYGLVEINAASTSGMYGCNCEPVIREMEYIIEKEQAMV